MAVGDPRSVGAVDQRCGLSGAAGRGSSVKCGVGGARTSRVEGLLWERRPRATPLGTRLFHQ